MNHRRLKEVRLNDWALGGRQNNGLKCESDVRKIGISRFYGLFLSATQETKNSCTDTAFSGDKTRMMIENP